MITIPPMARAVRAASARTVGAISALLLCAMVCAASAQQAFKTPDEAADALARAARGADRAAILAVLGPDGADIVSSGDEVADDGGARALRRRLRRQAPGHPRGRQGHADDRDGGLSVSDPARAQARRLAVRHRGRPAGNPLPAHRRATSSTRSRPASPMSMPRTNMPTRTAAPASAPMRSASSASRARRTASTGRRRPAARTSPLGELVARRRPPQGYRAGGGRARRSTATTTRS